jgi:AcrR family transcriptional regulator
VARHEAPEVRRTQILDAALRCFSKRGYHGARMDDIVDLSGLSKGAIYWHFKSKEEIFLALFDDLEAAIDGSWDQGQDVAPLDAIRLGCNGAIAALASLRPHAQTWTEFLGNPTSRRRLGRAYANARVKLGAVIDQGIDDGLVAPCDSFGAAAAITAMIEGLILQAFTDRRFDLDRAFATSWDLMARGLAPALVS